MKNGFSVTRLILISGIEEILLSVLKVFGGFWPSKGLPNRKISVTIIPQMNLVPLDWILEKNVFLFKV